MKINHSTLLRIKQIAEEVTVANFVQAETDRMFRAKVVIDVSGEVIKDNEAELKRLMTQQ
jgi:hypothetical protein